MCMKDWISELDEFSERYGSGVLKGAGEVSHTSAMNKAHEEYDAYIKKIADEETAVDREFLESVKQLTGKKTTQS